MVRLQDPSSSFLSAAEASNPVPASEKESYFRQQVEVLTGDLTKAYKERDEAKRLVEQVHGMSQLRKEENDFASLWYDRYSSLRKTRNCAKVFLNTLVSRLCTKA